MLLTIDAGNSDVKFGFFDGPKLVDVWRFPRRDMSSRDASYKHMEKSFGGRITLQDVEAIIISSVVRSHTLEWLAEVFFKLTPVFVNHKMKTNLTILYDDPSELGSDRLVDSVAAVEKYGAPCIVVDFGTATTFNAINSNREYLGGIIVPGIMTGLKSLTEHTRLPDVYFAWPNKTIGSTTFECLQSGLFWGTLDMVESFIKRIRADMGGSAKVIATGGLSGLLELRADYIDIFDKNLTLDGLRILYEMNKA